MQFASVFIVPVVATVAPKEPALLEAEHWRHVYPDFTITWTSPGGENAGSKDWLGKVTYQLLCVFKAVPKR
jgi:hypothetical protein